MHNKNSACAALLIKKKNLPLTTNAMAFARQLMVRTAPRLPAASYFLASHAALRQQQPAFPARLFSTSSDLKESLADPAKRRFMLKKYVNCMASLDSNKDGFVKRSDFFRIADEHDSTGRLSTDRYKKLIEDYERISASCGLTGDGSELPLEEAAKNWIKSLETTKPDPTREKPRYEIMFNNVDTDKDGEISFEEWTQHCRSYGVESHAKASFAAMDTNGDGKVSLEEFSEYLYEFFFSADNKLYSAILFGPVE